MVWLLTRGAKQNMQGVADNLGNGAIVGKHDVGRAGQIFVEKWAKHVRFERLHQRREAGDVREQRCDFPALPSKVYGIRVIDQPLGKIR